LKEVKPGFWKAPIIRFIAMNSTGWKSESLRLKRLKVIKNTLPISKVFLISADFLA